MGYYKQLFIGFCIGILFITGCSILHQRTQIKLEHPYTNTKYDIAFRIPAEWAIKEQSNLKAGQFAINAFKKGTGADKELPLTVHATMKHSYVAFWPHGFGTELPYGQSIPFTKADQLPDFKFPVNKKESELLLLKGGTVWAYFIVPENPPSSWEEYGFIFAQVRTTDTSANCFDRHSGEKISMQECNFLAGDRYIRMGEVDKQDVEAIQSILESISLKNVTVKETKSAD